MALVPRPAPNTISQALVSNLRSPMSGSQLLRSGCLCGRSLLKEGGMAMKAIGGKADFKADRIGISYMLLGEPRPGCQPF
jgi:hypothetical protein